MERNSAEGKWLAIGVGVGISIGVAIKNIGAGVAMGVGFGILMGRIKRKAEVKNDIDKKQIDDI